MDASSSSKAASLFRLLVQVWWCAVYLPAGGGHLFGGGD
jgi:hypothetical protein